MKDNRDYKTIMLNLGLALCMAVMLTIIKHEEAKPVRQVHYCDGKEYSLLVPARASQVELEQACKKAQGLE